MSLYDDFEPDPSHYAKEPPHIANRQKVAKQQTGLSLRDFFAAQAMQAMCYDVVMFDKFAACAKDAYKMADAMLAERNKP